MNLLTQFILLLSLRIDDETFEITRSKEVVSYALRIRLTIRSTRRRFKSAFFKVIRKIPSSPTLQRLIVVRTASSFSFAVCGSITVGYI